jgi:hypothetical protein
LKFLVVANAKLQIFGDLPKGLFPFLSAQLNFLSDTNNIELTKLFKQIHHDNHFFGTFCPSFFAFSSLFCSHSLLPLIPDLLWMIFHHHLLTVLDTH